MAIRAPYDTYNWTPWEEMLARSEEFADPQLRDAQYVAVVNGAGTLCGYGQLFPLTGEDGGAILRLGLGLKPELCGRGSGFGTALVRLLVAEAKRRLPGCGIDLEVLTWNERAIRAYRKAGFTIVDTYVRDTPTGPGEFHCMVYSDA
ncbi:GNAT family N-acetyltransferase [Gordoniibacillus kamchatkensis]|uniref:GNAT family N-acetyltransferase n=1 Tax=Gordoniibacillus kamchatkensis TaxID=1590651 RepID=UPI000B25AB43